MVSGDGGKGGEGWGYHTLGLLLHKLLAGAGAAAGEVIS